MTIEYVMDIWIKKKYSSISVTMDCKNKFLHFVFVKLTVLYIRGILMHYILHLFLLTPE